MKIISFLNAKGGVGKTTLCINLASYLRRNGGAKASRRKGASADARQGASVLLVDADPQGSIRDWEAAADESIIKVIAADTKKTLLNLRSIMASESFDYVLIDTPGKVSEIMASAVAISDLCILPIQPSPHDLWGSVDAVELIKTRKEVANGKPDACFVLNCCIPNTTICKEVLEHLQEWDFPVLGSCNRRIVYAQTAAVGQTVFESNNEEAIKETDRLGRSLQSMLLKEFEVSI